MKTIQAIKITMMYVNAIALLFLRLKSLIQFFFSQFETIFEIQAGHISFSLIHKILREIVGLLFSKVFQSSIFDE